MHTTVTALVTTATDLKHLRRGAELVKDASDLTSSLTDLTTLHLLAEDANDAMGKLMAVIDPPELPDAPAKQVAAGPTGTGN